MKIFSISAILLMSCSDNPVTESNEPKRLLSFEFNMDKNDIPVDSRGKVEETIVKIFLPPDSDLSNLIPDFQISENTTAMVGGIEVVSGITALDFSSGIEMKIVHDDNSEATYTIVVTTNDAAVDGAMKNMMEDFNIPGLQIAVVYQERLVYKKSYGWANKEEEIPVVDESVFRVASVSKPITVVSILKLIETGELNLNDTVFGSEGVLGFDFGTPPYGSHIEDITVKHLLDHESGWTNQPFDPVFRNMELSQKEMIDDILNNRPNSEPGVESAYLNFGYVVLGRVIEKVSGMNYDDYIKQEILAPIGITTMEVGRNSIAERYPNEVIYYPSENYNPYNLNVSRMDAAGGWVASAENLVNLLVHIDRSNRIEDILSNQSLQFSFLSYTSWIANGGMAGSNSSLSRINNDIGAAIILNTRIPGGDITDALNDYMRNDLNSRTDWPTYDLFQN
ncbi:MAG: serine hydrolase domain-containing protein [Balneolaceae bacterium]